MSRACSTKYRAQVLQLYKNLYFLGNDYPSGSLFFHERLKRAFAKKRDVTDEETIKALIAQGEYVAKEVEALYALRKYRAMKQRYYDED